MTTEQNCRPSHHGHGGTQEALREEPSFEREEPPFPAERCQLQIMWESDRGLLMRKTSQSHTTHAAVGTPVASIAASIPRANLYRLSRPFFTIAHSCGLSHRALRILHGLIHGTCRECDAWHGPCAIPINTKLIACRELRRRVGIRDRDNRTLAVATEELIASGLFDILEFHNNRHWLKWRLTDEAFFQLFSEPEAGFGYFDLRDMPQLRTVADFQMHDSLGICRAMRKPSVRITIASHESWEVSSRGLIKALHRTAGLFDCGFVVLLESCGSRIGIDGITVRMRLPHTRWGGQIVKRSDDTAQIRKVLLIDALRREQLAGPATYEEVQSFFVKKPRQAG